MLRRTLTSIARITVISSLFCMPVYAQNDFTGTDLLEWNDEAQASFISTSIVMASVIASQVRDGFAQCIGEWYLPDEETKALRNLEIMATIRDYPEYHPGGVLLAVVQAECGDFPIAR